MIDFGAAQVRLAVLKEHPRRLGESDADWVRRTDPIAAYAMTGDAATLGASASKSRRALGRQPTRRDDRVPRYAAVRRAAAYTHPASVHYADTAPSNLGMMLNGEDPANPGALVLGDCTCAAYAHAIQVWTSLASSTCLTPPNSAVLVAYEGGCGYVLGRPDTDQGGNELDVLSYFLKTGMVIAGKAHRLLAFYAVDPANLDELRQAIFECGIVYIGVNLPEAWEQCNPGDTLDATGSPAVGGHAGILTGYDKAVGTFDLIWWGMKLKVTEAGLRQALDEAYALVSSDWIEKTGLSPANLSAAEIEADMAALKEAA